MHSPGEAAVLAVLAGNDVVLHSPDDGAAFAGIRAAVKSGRDSGGAGRRVGRAPPPRQGAGRPAQASRSSTSTRLPASSARARTRPSPTSVSQRSITLVKDAARIRCRSSWRSDAQVLYLSVLDYPSGWRIAAPSRTFIPELRKRWPNVTSVELSDRTTPSELELVRAMAPRYDAVVASVFVRAASASGRMDLAAPLQTAAAGRRARERSREAPVRDDVLRQPVHGDVPAGAAGDAADLRLLRSRRAVGGARRWRARRRSAAGCRSRCRGCSRSGPA